MLPEAGAGGERPGSGDGEAEGRWGEADVDLEEGEEAVVAPLQVGDREEGDDEAAAGRVLAGLAERAALAADPELSLSHECHDGEEAGASSSSALPPPPPREEEGEEEAERRMVAAAATGGVAVRRAAAATAAAARARRRAAPADARLPRRLLWLLLRARAGRWATALRVGGRRGACM
jgi:hypothetical protein